MTDPWDERYDLYLHANHEQKQPNVGKCMIHDSYRIIFLQKKSQNLNFSFYQLVPFVHSSFFSPDLDVFFFTQVF